MAKVKVFVTDGQTDRQRDGRMRFNVPTLSRKRGTKNKVICKLSAQYVKGCKRKVRKTVYFQYSKFQKGA